MEKEIVYGEKYLHVLAGHEIFKKIKKVSMDTDTKAYVVGGFVRDGILGVKSKDIDVTVVGNSHEFADKLLKLIKDEGDNTASVAIFETYGTAQLKSKKYGEIEFVTARNESYSRDSRNPECHPGTLYEDLVRRDLTFNAMAISLCGDDTYGKLVDLFGGLDDLENRIARTPIDPDQTYSDDPLRMLRTIRFATKYDCKISDETFEGIKKNSERIRIIVKDRIHEELVKIISYRNSGKGIRLLYDTNLMYEIMSTHQEGDDFIPTMRDPVLEIAYNFIDTYDFASDGIHRDEIASIKNDLKWSMLFDFSFGAGFGQKESKDKRELFKNRADRIKHPTHMDLPRQFAIAKIGRMFWEVAGVHSEDTSVKKDYLCDIRKVLVAARKEKYSATTQKLWKVAFYWAKIASESFALWDLLVGFGTVATKEGTTRVLMSDGHMMSMKNVALIAHASNADEKLSVGEIIKDVLKIKEGKIYGTISEEIDDAVISGKIRYDEEHVREYLKETYLG